MQRYTRSLVTEEMNLGNMLEAAIRDIEMDRLREATVDTDDDEDKSIESSLFEDEYADSNTLKDFEEFEEFREALQKEDEVGEVSNGFE